MSTCLPSLVFLVASLGVLSCADDRHGVNLDGPSIPDLSGGLVPNPNDRDADGYTVQNGDCNDDNSLIGPMAIEIPGNHIDDDCDGMIDEPVTGCDVGTLGKKSAADLATALGFCENRFVIAAEMTGPSDDRARNIVSTYGSIAHLDGEGMVVLSTGIAADKSGPGYVRPQVGTSLSNEAQNPEPTLTAVADCGAMQPLTVNDYSELKLSLRVPQNVNSLKFQFQFLSAEFPEFVCSAYNDEFLVELESAKGLSTRNISFDAVGNPITINNGFFTICKNDPAKPQTQHCTKSVDGLAGTGYEDEVFGKPVGGSTGWLTTTAPVIPGDEIKLRFIIFDESDHIFDSAVLIDAFSWSPQIVSGPVTVP